MRTFRVTDLDDSFDGMVQLAIPDKRSVKLEALVRAWFWHRICGCSVDLLEGAYISLSFILMLRWLRPHPPYLLILYIQLLVNGSPFT